MARVIKRYANRRLYDTEASQSITLEGLVELVRAGEDVVVIDNASGEDVTHRVLAQAFCQTLLDSPSLLLQQVLLRGLIMEGGKNMCGLVKKLVLAGVGLSALSRDKVKEVFEELVSRGETDESEEAQLIREWLQKAEEESKKLKESVDQRVEKWQKKHGGSRDEAVRELTEKVDRLTEIIERMQADMSGGEKPEEG